MRVPSILVAFVLISGLVGSSVAHADGGGGGAGGGETMSGTGVVVASGGGTGTGGVEVASGGNSSGGSTASGGGTTTTTSTLSSTVAVSDTCTLPQFESKASCMVSHTSTTSDESRGGCSCQWRRAPSSAGAVLGLFVAIMHVIRRNRRNDSAS